MGVNGMLEHDDTNEYGEAFLKAGLLDEVITTLIVEPDMRAANSVCCDVLNKLYSHGFGQRITPQLKKANMIDIINVAFTTFHDDYPLPWNGMTVGQAYKVIPECKQ